MKNTVYQISGTSLSIGHAFKRALMDHPRFELDQVVCGPLAMEYYGRVWSQNGFEVLCNIDEDGGNAIITGAAKTDQLALAMITQHLNAMGHMGTVSGLQNDKMDITIDGRKVVAYWFTSHNGRREFSQAERNSDGAGLWIESNYAPGYYCFDTRSYRQAIDAIQPLLVEV